MISVALPVVKLDYFEQALQSVINQRFSDLEIIVLDNGAEAGLKDILENNPDPRIKLYSNERQLEMVDNWNHALSLATGEWFVLMCDDDYLEPEHLQAISQLLSRYREVDLFRGRSRVVDEEGRTIAMAPSVDEYEQGWDFIYQRIKYNRFQTLSEWVWRRERLSAQGGFVKFSRGWYADEATSFAMAIPHGVVTSNEISYNYRRSLVNTTTTTKERLKLRSAETYFVWLEDFAERNRDDQNEFCKLIAGAQKWKKKSVRRGIFLQLVKRKSYVEAFFMFLRYRSRLIR